MGDFNHGHIKWDSLQSTGVEDQMLLCLVQDNFLTQHVLEPTRVLYIVLSSQKEFRDNVVIQEPLGSSDHNQLHFNINIKSDNTKVKQCRRDFRNGNYKEIRKSLALIDGNDKMKNKTATECWNILRGELDSAMDSYVPMKKQVKRSKKKQLSKEAFRNIRYKQNMWRVYKHTGKDKDYVAYKEALNAVTNEVRKSKRNCEHKFVHNLKSDSKSFYAYVRSKQNVRDRVGPLEDNAGNIITQGILMAEELTMHFSSVSTTMPTMAITLKIPSMPKITALTSWRLRRRSSNAGQTAPAKHRDRSLRSKLRNLFSATGKKAQDEGNELTRDDFGNGYTIFGFDPTPDACDGGCVHLVRKGNLRTEIHVATALTQTVNVVVYGEF